MILNFILQQLHTVILFLISPFSSLPDAALPSYINTDIATAGQYIGAMANTFPLIITTLLGVFVLTLTIENWHFVYKVAMWIIHKIPGIS